jgi:hypothetical protein
MYGCSPLLSPNARLKADIFTVRLFSSTTVSGQTLLISSSFSITRPLFCKSTNRISKAFDVTGTVSPSLSNRRLAASTVNGPNSYNCRAALLIAALANLRKS